MTPRSMLHHHTALLLLALAGAAAPLASAAQPSSPPSAAEKLVFDDTQLRNVEPPQTLNYRFARSGSLAPPLADDVSIVLRARSGGGCCSAEGRFLSGERALALPTIDDAQANPVILYFLEHDVREMQRRTGGQPAHFRRRIRLALADTATVEPTRVRHAGREWPAQEVRIRPYADDPSRNRFARLADKEYVFVLAPGLPGGVARLSTRASAAAGDAPLIEETLTLTEP